MATVYLAIQENFQREVALKVMSPELSQNGDFSERFLREARIVSSLVHPHIVTVHDVGIQNGHHYLSMEYIEGEELKECLPNLSGEQLIRVVSDIAKALDYAGRKGYVHRDVKPENIMIHNLDGRSVLMDFGIARATDSVSTMTQTGTALGTPHYMSPEQARGKPTDGRSDLYSLGCLFFYILTGKVPYDADSPVAVGIKHVSADLPQLPSALSSYQYLIDKLMAKDPDERFQAGSELVAALAKVNASAIDRFRSMDGFEVIGSQAHTPLRNEAVKPEKASAKKSRPQGKASIKASREFDNIITGSHPQDALHIPREDLHDRRIKQKGSSWWLLLPLLLVVAALGGSYAYITGKLELPEVVAEPLSLDPVFKGQLPDFITNIIGDKYKVIVTEKLVAKEVATTLTKKSDQTVNVDENSQESLANDSSISDGITSDGGTSGDQLSQMLERIGDLEADIVSQPELKSELLDLYQQVLLSEPDNTEILGSIKKLKDDSLAAAMAMLENDDVNTASLRLNDSLELFPELSEDNRYLQLKRDIDNRQEIASLLSQAEKFLSSNRLLLPKGGNAKDSYDQVLALDKNNKAAKLGLKKIVTRYYQLASGSFKKGEYEKAQRFIASGLSLDANNKDLLLLNDSLKTQQEVQLQISTLLSEAQSLEQRQHWFGGSGSAVKKYLQVLAFDSEQQQASDALTRIVDDFTGEIESLIAFRDYELATSRVNQALQDLPSNPQLLAMQQELLSLAPDISQLKISGSEISDDMKPLAARIAADRTLYITFDFSNLEDPTTVFQAVLFDGARTVQIAGVPVVVVGAEGQAKFRINRPVESFNSGGYHLDILLAGDKIFSHSFIIEDK